MTRAFRNTASVIEQGKRINIRSSIRVFDHSRDEQLSVESPAISGETALLYEEDGGPKVEVVSIDGRPVQIVVHLESGRILELNCEY